MITDIEKMVGYAWRLSKTLHLPTYVSRVGSINLNRYGFYEGTMYDFIAAFGKEAILHFREGDIPDIPKIIHIRREPDGLIMCASENEIFVFKDIEYKKKKSHPPN